MGQDRVETPVYVETGTRRTFAGALEWPGWCRSGREEQAALEALVAYAPRYARAMEVEGLEPKIPTSAAELVVAERLEGNATTDFGAPAVAPRADERPLDGAELARATALLQACWSAFESAAQAAEGRSLRKGPRGGGRDLPGIIQHVVEANQAYLGRVAWKPSTGLGAGGADPMRAMLEELLQAVAAGAAGELPQRGPRGGKLWGVRYLVRRAAWHVLDHAWEIEDRLE